MAFEKPAAEATLALENVRRFLARLADQVEVALPEAFRRVCETGAETLDVERAGLWLFVNADQVLRCVNLFERSRRMHSKGACLNLTEYPVFLRAVGSAPFLSCENARSDPRVSELGTAYLGPLGIASVLDVPLRREGRVVGGLFFEHVGSPRTWSESDRAIALQLGDFIVERMKSAEGTLRTAPRTQYVSVPSAVPAPARLAHDLEDLLGEIEVLARSPGLAGASERFRRIADAAARGASTLRKLFDSQAEPGGRDTLPDPPDDDTGEHQALTTTTG